MGSRGVVAARLQLLEGRRPTALFGRWSPNKNWEINLSIQNVFDKKAPFDPYLVNTYGINYNQTWHQSGAVGRFWTIGAKYTF